jgi:hypothetical protein
MSSLLGDTEKGKESKSSATSHASAIKGVLVFTEASQRF